jgi:hypothetical protein
MLFPLWRLIPYADVTLSKLKLVLATEEATLLANGRKPPHDITPSGFLRLAIDIEERQ